MPKSKNVIPAEPRRSAADIKTEREAVRSTMLAGKHRLSPSEIARIRAQIASNVSDYLPLIDEVIRGTRDFSPTQARLFTALLNKVVPDLSASYHQHEHNTVDLNTMSLADLERIAAGVEASLPPTTKDDLIEGEVLTPRTPSPPPQDPV